MIFLTMEPIKYTRNEIRGFNIKLAAKVSEFFLAIVKIGLYIFVNGYKYDINSRRL